jgi:penicillin-binding protein 2
MFRFRIKLLSFFIICVIFFIFIRLSFLQYYKSQTYVAEVRNRNVIEERLEPIRGSIYDCKGKSIAEQVPSFNLILNPLRFPFKEKLFINELKSFLAKANKMTRAERLPIEEKFINRLNMEIPQYLNDPLIIKLNKILKKEEDEFVAELIKVFETSIKGWILEPIFYNLKYEKAVLTEIDFNGIKGLEIKNQTIRSYPQGWSLTHVIGQLQNLQEDEIEEITRTGKLTSGGTTLVQLSNEEHQYLLPKNELSNLWVGRTGLENYFNKDLSGVSGERCSEKVITKNSEGEVVKDYVVHYEMPPLIGKDLHLTIDVDLQKIAEKAMREKFRTDVNGGEISRVHVGSFVAINPQTGEILALVSVPDFDPNALIPPIDKDVVNDVILGKTQPSYLKAFNRATQSRYAPGSPFKMFVALLALEDKAIDSDYTVFCSGSIKFPNGEEYKCNSQYGHQRLEVIKAIKKSCNVFFYTVGMKIGTERQAWWSNQFGFGHKTGIELPHEYAGRLPKARLNAKNQPIPDLYVDSHFSIGQVDLEVTPMQMARAVSLFANGGYLVSPHMIKSDELSKTRTKLPVSQKNIDIVVEGLFQVVNEVGGTAYSIGRSDEFVILGKTGTADTGGHPSTKNPRWMDPYYRFSQSSYPPHAWFVGFAPRINPTIAFACISEHSGHGGDIAAPVVKKIIEEYFRLLKIREENEPKG